MAERTRLVPALVYTALAAAIISSLGLLLVPTIAAEFGVAVSTAQWTVTINLLVGAVATPVLGRLSDGPHKRRILLVTLAVVLVGSVLAATAQGFGQMVAGRALQGMSYAITPMTIALARRYAPADKVRAGIASLSVTVATGVGLGYPLTGIIAATFDFRWAFWFAAAFVVSAIVVVLVAVPGGPDEHGLRQRFDTLGAALLGVGLAALLLGISEGPRWGWGSTTTLGILAGAVVVLAAWVWRETSTPHPLVRLDLLRRPDVLLANATALSIGTSMYIGVSVISLIAQTPTETGYGVGLPLFWAGFVMFPISVGSQVASRLARRFAHRVSYTMLLPIGAGFATAANLLMVDAHDELWELLVGMLLIGTGIGTTYAAMPGLIARGVAAQELGSAVSFNQVLRTIGGSIGSAVAGAIIATHLAPDLLPTGRGIELTFVISALACGLVLVGLTTHAVLTARRARRALAAEHARIRAADLVHEIEVLEPHDGGTVTDDRTVTAP
ncbi:MAG TPA: MFS transporter [Cellulomonas sp.]|nr:MFS transporter [Cellulomonas sp.]